MQENQLGNADPAGSRAIIFRKLLLNFSWWVNRKDRGRNNVFEGGFLGLDNMGVFDRSAPLPTGGTLEQADGSAWMCVFSQNMLEIALELARDDPGYQDLAAKFMEHFLWIAAAMDRVGVNADELWDEEDGFFYDVLWLPDGSAQRIKIRSLVGLLPLCATVVIPAELIKNLPRFTQRLDDFLDRHGSIFVNIHPPKLPGAEGRYLLSVCDEAKLRRILTRMLDEERFFSPFGIRSLSKWHERHPYTFDVRGERTRSSTCPRSRTPACSAATRTGAAPSGCRSTCSSCADCFSSTSTMATPSKIECPTGSGRMMNLFEVAMEIARLTRIFLRDEQGRRPVYGGAKKFQEDPHWRDHVLFYEYFHGDNGAGLGASHQTGWTGLVAKLIQMLHVLDPQEVLKGGSRPVMEVYEPPPATVGLHEEPGVVLQLRQAQAFHRGPSRLSSSRALNDGSSSATVVDAHVVQRSGEDTGARPGRVVRALRRRSDRRLLWTPPPSPPSR